jgi:uncharacterized Zn-finger protein
MVMASLRNQRLDVRNSAAGSSSKAVSGTVVAEEDYNDEDELSSELLIPSDDHDTGIGQFTDDLEMEVGIEDPIEEEDQSSLFSNDLNNNRILGENSSSLLSKSFGQLPLLQSAKPKRSSNLRSSFGQLDSNTSIWPDYELNTSQKIQQQLASLASPLLDYSSLFDLGAAAKLSGSRKTNGSSRAPTTSQPSRQKNKTPSQSTASSLASLGSMSSMSNMAKIASLAAAAAAASVANDNESTSLTQSTSNLNVTDDDHLVVPVNPIELLDERLTDKMESAEQLSTVRDQNKDLSFTDQLQYLNQSQFDHQMSSTTTSTPVRSSSSAKAARRSNASSGESKSAKSKRRSAEEKTSEAFGRSNVSETESSLTAASNSAAFMASEEFDSDDKNNLLGKKCVCPYCPQTFTQRNSLNRHIRSHTGERPFPCEFCGKCFSDKQRLLIHTRIHTGEKPFSCSICFRQFTQKSTVKRHLIVHFGHSSGKADEARAKQFAKAKSKELNELILCSLKPIPKPGETQPDPPKSGLSPAAAKLLRQTVSTNLRRPPPLQRIPKQSAGKSLLDNQSKDGQSQSVGISRSASIGLKRPKLEKIGRKSLSSQEEEDFEADNEDDDKNLESFESAGETNHMSQDFEGDDDEEEDEVEDEEEDEDDLDEEDEDDGVDDSVDLLQKFSKGDMTFSLQSDVGSKVQNQTFNETEEDEEEDRGSEHA